MDKDEIRIKKYESALSLLFYEGQIAWQLNVVFIALNVGLATLISNRIKYFRHVDILLAVYGVLGIVISFAWLGTFSRNNRYYHFRMAQAREAEPEGWNLLKNRGYKFSKGKKITITNANIEVKDKDHQLTAWEKRVSNKNAVKIVIYLFLAIYFTLFVISLMPIKICS